MQQYTVSTQVINTLSPWVFIALFYNMDIVSMLYTTHSHSDLKEDNEIIRN